MQSQMKRSFGWLVAVCALGFCHFCWAQSACREEKLTAFDGGVFQFYAYAVASSGSKVMIGARWDNDLGSNSGSVSIYERQSDPNGNWVFAQKLLASDGQTNNLFGYAVAVEGEVGLVGAIGHFHDEDSGSGSAYIFRIDRNGSLWHQEAELLASDGNSADSFGTSVSISGNVALIGANLDDDDGPQSGSAYVFRYDTQSQIWIEEQKLLASDGVTGNFFGNSVAVCADVAVIGALGHDDACKDNNVGCNSGAVYVFRFDPKSSSWVEEQKLLASDAMQYDNFGSSVAIDGQVIVVGAKGDNFFEGSAYVFRFDPSTSTWIEEQNLTGTGGLPGQFGRAVAIDDDALVISSWRDDIIGANLGAAYLFDYDNIHMQWNQRDILVPDPGPWTAFFGWSVALDGDYAVCSSHGENNLTGAAYIYNIAPNCNCPHDLDGSGSVGTSDLLELFAQWGTAGSADFDGSGAVGTSDLLILFANWGPCP